MNDLTVVDSIYLDAQQKEDVRRLSSLGYSSKDIAVSLGAFSGRCRAFCPGCGNGGNFC